jgi:hypothetical protein
MRNFFNYEETNTPNVSDEMIYSTEPILQLEQPEDGSLFSTEPIDQNYINSIETLDDDTLASDQRLNSQLRSYLKLVGYGAVADEWDNEEVVKKWITQMRNIDSTDTGIFGESLAVRREKPENLHHYKTAYDMWDKYPSIFQRLKGKHGSTMDGVMGAMEHVGNVLNPIESPSNYIPGVVVGKFLGKYGGSKVIKDVAKDKLVNTAVASQSKNMMLKQIGYTSMADAAVALGLDAIYQDFQKKVGRQDGYNTVDGFISLFEGLIGGGVDLALHLPPKVLRERKFTVGGKEFDGFLTKKVKTDAQKAAILEKISLKNEELIDFWSKKTKGGRKLLEEDSQYADLDFIKLYMFGNKDMGVKGMVETMTEDLDLVYFKDLKKASGDKQFMAAFIKLMDESTAPQIKAAFTKKMRNVGFKGESPFANKLAQPTSWDGFMKSLAFTMSDAGQKLNVASQVQRMVLNDAKSVKYSVDGAKLMEQLKKIHPRPWHYLQAAWKRGVVSTYSTSSLNFSGWLAATGLNAVADTGLMLLHTALIPPKLMGNTIKHTFDRVNYGESKVNILGDSIKEAKDIFNNQIFRIANLLDPTANKEAFLKMLEIDTEGAKALRHAIIGGVDVRNVEDLAKQFGYVKEVDGKIVGAPPAWMRVNEDYYLKYAQKLMLVNAIDTFTKSQAYIGNLDRYLRNKYNMGFMEFTRQSDVDLRKQISSQEFFEMTAEVTDRTLEDIFTKSYQKAGLPVGMQEIATALEKVGDIPGLGTLLPFGKFMNNTLALLYDGLGGGSVNWMAKVAKYGMNARSMNIPKGADIFGSLQDQRRVAKGFAAGGPALLAVSALGSDEEGEDNWWESTVRGAMRLSAIGQCVIRDQEKIEQGLAWDQEIIDGKLVSIRYMFPLSNCAILGRAYNIKKGFNINEETGERSTVTSYTPEFKSDLADQFVLGQITRNAKSVMNLRAVIEDALDFQNKSWEEIITKTMTTIPQNLATGYTRPYGDAFQKLSTYYLGEDDVKLKVPNKASYQAMVFGLTRYTSNLIRSLTGEKEILGAVEDRTPFRADATYTSGGWYDLLGMKSQGRMTYMEQLLNKTNLQGWKQQSKYKSSFRDADVYMNRLVAPRLEHAAYTLLHDDEWNKASQDDKTKMVQNMISDTMTSVLNETINGSVLTNQDFSFEKEGLGTEAFAQRLRLVMEIAKLNKRDFTETIQNFNKSYDKDLDVNIKLKDLEELSTMDLMEMINISKSVKDKRP